MNHRGMTFVELLFTLMITAVVLGVTIQVYIMVLTMYKNSQTESALYADGKFIMEMVQSGEKSLYGLMKARSNSIAIAADGRSVTFSVDKNGEYTQSTADDIGMSVALDDGDGDPDTTEDNEVVIDPNTAAADDTFAVGSGVEDLQFALNGDVLTVNLTLVKTFRGDPMRVSLSRDIWVRN